MTEILPSLLVDSKVEFEKRLRQVDQHVKTVHVDILDGTLFPHTSWYDALSVSELKTPVQFELHLMVENPLPIIETWSAHVPGTVRAIIHAEIDRQLEPVIERITQWHKLQAGIALNPETPATELRPHVDHIESALIMGVHPGASGQPFGGESILNKIEEIHRSYPNLTLSCDGGVSEQNASDIVHAGCARLVTASAVFAADDIPKAIQSLKSIS